MVISAISSALSGLNASSLRLTAAASNIANQESTTQEVGGVKVNKPYVPVDVVQTSIEPNGVSARLEATNRPPALRYQPDSSLADDQGLVAYPDVDIANESVNRILSSNQFKANIEVLRRADDAQKSLLDELS